MPYKNQFATEDDQKGSFIIQKYPDQCPICKGHGQPDFITATGLASVPTQKRTVHAAFRCPRESCRGLYIGVFLIPSRETSGEFHGVLTKVQTFQFTQSIDFPPNIEAISPTACEIYRQSRIAEENGLSQIIGPAYRKALEFLVKDFVIAHKCPGDAPKQDEVRRKLLGAVINEFIDEDLIKNCAKRAAWLGNDETHYVRKWQDKDINDLKALIKITMNFIDMTLEVARYMKDMADPKS